MSTTISLDFDTLPDELAVRLLESIEQFIGNRHPYLTASVPFHGGRIIHDDPSRQTCNHKCHPAESSIKDHFLDCPVWRAKLGKD